MTNKKEYSRLPGRGLKRGASSLVVKTRARLYAGSDHLLCVYNTGYAEDYKRFYYKDIQAIVTHKTTRGKVWNIVFAIFALGFALLSLTTKDVLTVLSLIVAGLFTLLFFINWLRGPTCKSYLYTAVSKEELPSLSRQKNALKAMNRLRLIIENIQGKLTSEELSESSAEISERDLTDTKPKLMSKVLQQAQNYNGWSHAILFYLLLVAGVHTFIEFFLNNMIVIILGVLAGSALAIIGIISVVKQHDSNMSGGLAGVTWATLGYIFLSFIVNYIIYMYIAIKNPGLSNNQWELLKMYSKISPFDNQFFLGFSICSTVYFFAGGAIGLALLRKFRVENSIYIQKEIEKREK